MIKANELRLGNWIEKEGKPHKISRHDFYEIYFSSERFCSSWNPIELTPEILEACGFKMNHVSDFYKDNFVLNSGHREFYYWSAPMNTKIKYLHQLQNLYFALTAKELTITFKELV